MTKNPNQGLFIFILFVRGEGGGVHGLVGQGEVLAREWEQLFSYVTHCINIALRFHEDMPVVLTSWLAQEQP